MRRLAVKTGGSNGSVVRVCDCAAGPDRDQGPDRGAVTRPVNDAGVFSDEGRTFTMTEPYLGPHRLEGILRARQAGP